MFKNKKFGIEASIVLVLIVVGFLIFITINNKDNSSNKIEENNINMGDTQNIDEVGDVDLQEEEVVEEKNNTKTTTSPQSVDGVKITVLKEGTGERVAKFGDTVAMAYTGVLADGTVFDSNVNPKFNHVEPFIFTLGAGQVIQGWDIGVAGMKAGEQRELEISPEFAYGPNGIEGVIPKNATLTFMIELVAIKE
ncbi:MAG: FKBP-type peptidyl-prolyl cis-trans isomerase [Patescibacteria group bacterium]